jgi:osmotically-inducible protein OsmY
MIINRLLAIGCFVTVPVLLSSCTENNKSNSDIHAKDIQKEAKDAAQKADKAAKELAHAAKRETRELDQHAQNAMNGPAADEAAQKLHSAARDARQAGNEAKDEAGRLALITRVKSALINDVGLKTVTKIDVDAAGHVVTLYGTVPTVDDKRRAEATVSSISGVQQVIDKLQVQSPAS